MVEESEKRFHAVMDKLFHAPPKSNNKSTATMTNSVSSSGVERGKKRPSTDVSFALTDPKSKGNMVERLQNKLASNGSVQTPLCRPWDRGDLMRRLATFKAMTWFAKPKVVSAVNCARRGWVNVEMDTIACESCGARLLFTTPPSWTQQQVEKAALVFSLKLDNGHKLLCPWIDNICDEKLALFPPMPAADLVDDFKKRCSALLHLSALPLISSSAIDFMKCPQLDHFLRESSSEEFDNGSGGNSQTEYLGNECDAESSFLYYQTQKLISLCGWVPRLLPYIVDCKNQQDQSKTDASHLDSSSVVSSRQNLSISVSSSGADEGIGPDDDSMAFGGLQSDPSSVVLDCKLCGASVGLWTFSTIPRPVELLRLIGHSEINSENGSVCHEGAPGKSGLGNENYVEAGSVPKSATAFVPTLNDRPSNLNFTIAGGPPPTKQHFRATISLPVIGQNLRARISSDLKHRNFSSLNSSCQEGKEKAVCIPTKQGSQPDDMELLEGRRCDDGHCNSASGDQLPCLEYDGNQQGSGLTNENSYHMSLDGTNIGGQGSLETSTPNFINEKPIQESPNLVECSDKGDELPENAENVETTEQEAGNVENSSSTILGADVAIRIGESSEIDTSVMVAAENGCMVQNQGIDTVGKAQVDSQDSCGTTAKFPHTNDDLSCWIGNNLEKLPADKGTSFNPIIQHRHFCPWITSVDNAAPGWQQTLSALQRLKQFSCSSSPNGPSSSLIEVDDPIASVRKLFMSPSPKRRKLAGGSS